MDYRTILKPVEAEFTVKKSRFIGRLYPAASMDEARETLEKVKKQYWDATHNCSAIVVGERREYTRSSDDGEPQGTAGAPMLEALLHSGLTNVLAVATRYFGGILLGAGGLVRAYTACVSEAVQAAQIVQVRTYEAYTLTLPFKLWGRAEAALRSAGYALGDVAYTAEVTVKIYTQPGSGQRLAALAAELSSGKTAPVFLGEERRVEPCK